MNLTVVTDEHGDWEGVFIEGELYEQEHMLDTYKITSSIEKAIEKNGGGITSVNYITVDGEWMFQQGHLPGTIDEIPKEARKE